MRPFAIAAVLTLATTALACAAPTDREDEASSDQSAITEGLACNAQQRSAALAHYTSGVDRSKAKLRGEACDDNTTFDILNELGQSVAKCGDFRNVIATSPWASPARKVLKGNLALAVLTGKLEVKDATGRYTWKGLDESLVGVTMFGPAPGVYGHMSKITFRAKGAATISRLEIPDTGAAPHWVDTAATYEIGSGRTSAAVTIEISEGRNVMSYSLSESPVEAPYASIPVFALEIPAELDQFTSLEEECSA